MAIQCGPCNDELCESLGCSLSGLCSCDECSNPDDSSADPLAGILRLADELAEEFRGTLDRLADR